MKRGFLRRKQPLRPGAARLARHAALPKTNPQRRAKRTAEGKVYSAYHEWIGTLPCVLAGKPGHVCWGRVTGHHMKTVGAGGQDRANEVPVCWVAHNEIGSIGYLRFTMRYGIDLRALAVSLARDWDERQARNG